MRAAILLAALAALVAPAAAQTRNGAAAGPHDGIYEGVRYQDCGNRGVRIGQERVVAEIRQNRITIPSLPGDPPLEGDVAADGKVQLPAMGLFRPGEGQVFEGPNNARRFVSSNPGRGQCRMVHELLRQRPPARGR